MTTDTELKSLAGVLKRFYDLDAYPALAEALIKLRHADPHKVYEYKTFWR